MRKQKIFFPAVMLVFYKGDKYLLTHRIDDNPQFNKVWQIPGGGWEFDETLEEALEREIYEELGIKVKQYKFLPKIFEEKRENIHLIFFIFYAPFPKNAKIKLNKEADKYEWLTLSEVKKLKSLPLTVEILEEVEKYKTNF